MIISSFNCLGSPVVFLFIVLSINSIPGQPSRCVDQESWCEEIYLDCTNSSTIETCKKSCNLCGVEIDLKQQKRETLRCVDKESWCEESFLDCTDSTTRETCKKSCNLC